MRSNVKGMTDERWKSLTEPHDRLRWARIQWQERKGIKPEASAAAESLGMAPHTYRRYERAPDATNYSALDHQKAVQFGRKYGVSWAWLLNGKGDPFEQPEGLSEVERQMIDALREAPKDRQAAAADAIIRLLKIA